MSVSASESTSLDISARHPLSCDFLRDTPTCIFVSAGASESTSLDISAAIPSVATSCEIRRLVSSSPPAPPNRRHWISPPPSPQLRLLARYADSYISVRRRLRIDVTGYLRPSSPQLRLLARYADLYFRLRRRLRIDATGYLRRHPLSCDFLRDTPTRILVSVGASESTSLDISARRFKSHLKCTFLTFSTQSTNDRSSAEPQKCRRCLSR